MKYTSEKKFWLQAIADTKLLHCIDNVAALPEIPFHNISTQASTLVPRLTPYHPKSTEQNKMKTSKNKTTLTQRHFCESRLTEGFR